MTKTLLPEKTFLLILCLAYNTFYLPAQTISYLIPDIGASGQNTYVEFIGPYNQNGNFGTDGLYTNNVGDAVRVVCANSADTGKVTFGPVVVGWSGKMVSTQVFVAPGLTPNSTDWQQLLPAYKIPVQVLLNGTAYSNVDTFYIVQPQPAITISGAAVLGSGGGLGTRSRRGAMLVSSLDIQAGANVTVSTADCDPYTAGNQGYLPIHILSTGIISIANGATVSVSALGGQIPDAGPGGGGGGTESWTNNTTCGGGPNAAGAGFTGGGTEKFCCLETPGPGTGSTSACLGCGLDGLNGVQGGAGGTVSCTDQDDAAGGTGHPFGTSGDDDLSPGGYGGGSGWAAYAGGGYGSAGTAQNAGSEGMVNGNPEMVPFAGGSGGSGGVAGPGTTRGGGGGGGGALLLYSYLSNNIVAGGQVLSKGGAGVVGATTYSGGGGGSGGGVLMSAKLGSAGSGAVSVAGSTGGVGGVGQGGNGGAGRVRFDGPFSPQPSVTPIPGAGSATSFNGPSMDTSQYVQRVFTITGTGNGQAVNIYLKPQGKPWALVATVSGYTSNWTQEIVLPCPDTVFLLTAAQQIANPGAAQYTMDPAWTLSQAAANFLYTSGHFTAAFTANPVCQNVATQFTDQSTGTAGHAVEWLWNFGDNGTSTIQNPGHTYATAGSYTVLLLAADTANCPDTISHTVVVYPLPVTAFTASPVCLNTPPTQFNNLSTGATQWLWTFNDGSNSTLQSPSHVYTAATNYSDTLIAITNNGCTDTVTQTVVVYPVPVASFTAANVCFPSVITFNNTSTGAVAYGWSFGDGTTSIIPSPTHTYAAAGSYAVTLIAISNMGCADTIVQTVVVSPKPVAAFTAPGVCVGTASVFTNTSTVTTGSIVAIAWSFGDAGVSTLPNPTHTYAAFGTYTAALIVQTDSSCADTVSNQVQVYQNPVAAFIADTPCIGKPTQFTDQTTPLGLATLFSWAFGDAGTSTLENPVHTYATAGNFNVVFIATSANNCADTITNPILVKGSGKAQFTAPDVCLNNPTIFTNNSDTATYPIGSWNWNFGNNTGTSTQSSGSYVYPATGTYTVTLIADFANGCADTAAQPVTVYVLPTDTATVNNVTCFGKGNGSIVVTPVDGQTPFIYNWSNGFTGGNNASLSPGNYVVTFTDAHQCTGTAGYTITQPTQLYADTVITPIVCYGLNNGSIALTDTGGTPPYAYLWNTGDQSNMINNLAPGTYTVTISDFELCSLTETVVLQQTPPYQIVLDSVATINLGESIQLNTTTLNGTATSWLWSPDNFLSCTQCPNPVVQPYLTFTYMVQSTSDKGCEASNSVTVTVIPAYSVYFPNAFTPNGDGVDDFFEVFGNKDVWQFFSIEIFDRLGEKVFESNDMNFKWDGMFKGKPLPVGVYVYEARVVYTDNHTDKLYKGGVTLLK
jgi:gliding motility-associated-like protein